MEPCSKLSKYTNKLRKRSEKERRRIAIGVTTLLVVIIAGAWVVSLSYGFTFDREASAEDVAEVDGQDERKPASPFNAIGNIFSGSSRDWDEISEGVQGIRKKDVYYSAEGELEPYRSDESLSDNEPI